MICIVLLCFYLLHLFFQVSWVLKGQKVKMVFLAITVSQGPKENLVFQGHRVSDRHEKILQL